jgi:hypothetical protein
MPARLRKLFAAIRIFHQEIRNSPDTGKAFRSVKLVVHAGAE